MSSSNGSVRKYWIDVLTKIADPVLESLNKEELRKKMPVEVSNAGKNERREVATHLEAFGRLLSGMAPWLALGADKTEEGKLREKYIKLVVNCMKNAVNPESPDFMNFNKDSRQPLVDAAFLAHAMLRAPNILWDQLDDETKANWTEAMKSTRVIRPNYNNWLLFQATVEAALFKFTGSWDFDRVEHAVSKHLEWYKGDGLYGDGQNFHWDYYNSFVIHPMLLDVLKVCRDNNIMLGRHFDLCLTRAQRYATIQERLISPEGTFPAIGRSLAYRFGAFQNLAHIALWHALDKTVTPAQVRCGLTAVIKRVIEAPGTFDKDGWLQIGFYGHQPDIGEEYISTGSLYLASFVFLPLGLPAEDEFWSAPDADWTQKKVWAGKNIMADHALED